MTDTEKPPHILADEAEAAEPANFDEGGKPWICVEYGDGGAFLMVGADCDVKVSEIEGILLDDPGSPAAVRTQRRLTEDGVTVLTPVNYEADPCTVIIRTIGGGEYPVHAHWSKAKQFQRALLTAWREAR